MEIMTRDFGKIEIDKSDIISFNSGLPGFENLEEFILLPLAEESPFIIMQSVEDPDIAFVTVEPGNLIQNYEFEISDKTEKKLKIESVSNLLILNIITLKNDFNNSTANLSAPIVINLEEKLGQQVILDDQRYQVRYKIFAAAEEVAE
ncbi:flagellar assembly factor FliW [Halanaerobium saccharolyticum]|uniref:Flagellar assembly factor FliW n=1 Tax=Halanaerobium saccharolyticum TaxID=43595 RepID=A0A4V3G3Y5_9FIRM|nr:flagellar assembly protein FliW [Halanaerobium saccharolyticum]RAK04925.1 flagellar assembly factor FliW [Halanaerobium saccharolyticum]TDV98297.1 flagellar assembly factor FliW [Halanaerobium saccharolyticum]TDX51235.1 flagellar assembly factor FliW [Halanaerobium saccharolyticum]